LITYQKDGYINTRIYKRLQNDGLPTSP
jgi:hypothetical protein